MIANIQTCQDPEQSFLPDTLPLLNETDDGIQGSLGPAIVIFLFFYSKNVY